ncbi:MAG: hypothetical protein L6R38_003987 [Xanthoria sp. 2 TBL-2021]|nr:MAG: hypothetical protein L6R38_003987 [Xanthoria sp. 2 TBL-2021]
MQRSMADTHEHGLPKGDVDTVKDLEHQLKSLTVEDDQLEEDNEELEDKIIGLEQRVTTLEVDKISGGDSNKLDRDLEDS